VTWIEVFYALLLIPLGATAAVGLTIMIARFR
jgi:hypothetical protein